MEFRGILKIGMILAWLWIVGYGLSYAIVNF